MYGVGTVAESCSADQSIYSGRSHRTVVEVLGHRVVFILRCELKWIWLETECLGLEVSSAGIW